MNYAPFASWDDVLAHVTAGHPIYYHAPLDYRPVHVLARVRGRRIRIDPFSSDGTRFEGSRFTADEGHLSRFRKGVRAAE